MGPQQTERHLAYIKDLTSKNPKLKDLLRRIDKKVKTDLRDNPWERLDPTKNPLFNLKSSKPVDLEHIDHKLSAILEDIKKSSQKIKKLQIPATSMVQHLPKDKKETNKTRKDAINNVIWSMRQPKPFGKVIASKFWRHPEETRERAAQERKMKRWFKDWPPVDPSGATDKLPT